MERIPKHLCVAITLLVPPGKYYPNRIINLSNLSTEPWLFRYTDGGEFSNTVASHIIPPDFYSSSYMRGVTLLFDLYNGELRDIPNIPYNDIVDGIQRLITQ